MTDFLLELRSEEIPARMQAKARADLARLFAEQLNLAGLSATAIETHATPRRLALIARGLLDATQAVSEEIKGPRADAPPQALAGFLGKVGLTRDQLVERADAKGNAVLFAVIDRPGRATAQVLAEAIPTIVRAFPWPKSMRWGPASLSTESPRWVRPLQGIVALFGEEIVPFEIAGVTSGAATLGHRFHHPGIITIGSADDYEAKLRACHVILNAEERADIIRDGARAVATAAGLTLVEDESLVAENAGLTEWPVPLLGRFDPSFLEVPREVIQLTMRTNQKYFACVNPPRNGEGDRSPQASGGGGPAGALAPAFICTANIAATDGGAAIVAGNERVLSARLSDAKFFWEADLKVPLEEQAKKLGDIVFHEKLGTVADKVERVAKLARWLVEEGIVREKSSPDRGGGPPAQPVVEGAGASAPAGAGAPLHQPAAGPPPRSGEEQDLATLTERAARLCKADLVTQSVGEFPELQGIIGAHLARAQGEPAQVADAISDHYKPVGQGNEVPTAPVTVAVSLADKLDTVLEFFGSNQKPSGSKDPFALRRAALGIIEILISQGLRLPFRRMGEEFFWSQVRSWNSKAGQRAYGWGRSFEDEIETENGERFVMVERSFTDIELHQGDLDELGEIEFITAHRRDYHDDGNSDNEEAIEGGRAFVIPDWRVLRRDIVPFFADRLKVQQREAGVRHDLIDAMFALGGEDDLVRLLARVKALQAFVETAEGRDLLAGYKRAANILKKEGYTPLPLREREGPAAQRWEGEGDKPSPEFAHPHPSAALPLPPSPVGRGKQISLSYTPEPVESSLIAALDSAGPRARAAIEAEDFAGAMAALASLRAPVDAFFDNVTVNDPDADKRAARLALLDRLRAAVHGVADFSKIEG